jgi:hypothetical protein
VQLYLIPELLPNKLTYKQHTPKKLTSSLKMAKNRLKCVGAIINKNTIQQVGIKYTISKRSAGLDRTLQNKVCDTP